MRDNQLIDAMKNYTLYNAGNRIKGILIKTFVSACLLFGCISQVFAEHKGYVFVDKNGNGVFDKGEKALKGVAVSDGLSVVLTAADGSFSLPGHPKERFIFITTPGGFKTNNAHYRKIEPGNPEYSFALEPYEATKKDGSHSFIHIADTEIFNTENHEDWISSIRGYAVNEGAAFIIHTGDICYEKGLESHIRLMNTEVMNCPVFYCIGNHDLVKGTYGEELYESLYGPVYYSFDAGSVHYIVTPMLGGDYRPGYTKEDVYRWMKNDLALLPEGKAVMVFNHDLLTGEDEFIYGINDREFIRLNDYNLKAWIYGHWHIHYMKKQGDVRSISTGTPDKGGIDHSTSAFRVMHVDNKGDFSSELRYTYIDKSIRIASLTDGQAPVLASGSVPLSVNVYSSVSPVKEVSYVCEVNGRQAGKKKKLQQQTDWNWYQEIPSAICRTGDSVKVRVTAVFNNGETVGTECTFTYPEDKPVVRLGTDWTNLSGDPAHQGISSDTLRVPLVLAWVENVKANIYMSSPLVYKGNIYVASVDENLKGDGHIYALDGKSGRLLWKYPVRNSIKNTIAADNGFIFAQDAEGFLYAVSAETGELGWEKKLAVNGLPALIEGLVVSDGVVYAGTGKGLCALKSGTGEEIWTNTGWGQGEGTTSTLSLGDGVLIGGAQWRGLYGNEASTGKMLWQTSKNGLSDRGASPSIHRNLAYIISRSSLFILDTRTGETIVRKDLPEKVDVTSTPLLTDKEIIFGTSTSGLIALDRETLDRKWVFQVGEGLVYTGPYIRKPAAAIETSPVLSGSTVYVGASDGSIYGIDKKKGTQVWCHQTGAPVFSTVSVSGNALIATDFSGNVYAFVSSLSDR